MLQLCLDARTGLNPAAAQRPWQCIINCRLPLSCTTLRDRLKRAVTFFTPILLSYSNTVFCQNRGTPKRRFVFRVVLLKRKAAVWLPELSAFLMCFPQFVKRKIYAHNIVVITSNKICTFNVYFS